MNDYQAFLDSKKLTTVDSGKVCGELHPALFDFQRDIVRWSVRKGRAAIFADVGLGKTVMYCEWCRQLQERTLILTPLAVAQQTVNMARDLLDMELRYVRSMSDVDFDSCLFYVTNYEMLEHFDAAAFNAVVLDESSILKAFSGTTKKLLISTFKDTPYKLCCTATPAPNDLLEIGNHADFLGVMSSRLMTSIFFTHDSQSAKSSSGNKYRLKKHATGKFYEWLASWSVALKKPSDLGYDDTGYELPELRIEVQTVNAGFTPPGMLAGFGIQSISATERDLGNSKSNEEFLEHYRYIVREKLRITMPGRYSCVHIQDTKIYGLNNNGNRGLYPLSDEIVRLHIEAGWTFRARITIDKNPQLVATRNHDNDLLFVTGKRDGCDLAPMNTDYLLVFEKPGKNPVPVKPYENGEMTEEDWIRYARACWYDIRETDVLNVDVARTNEDERHLCPLQLGLIERCLKMWSNPGELIFSPFAGIGSELYEAVHWKRRALGIELKPEYHRVAVRNLELAETKYSGRTLFDLLPADVAAGD